MAFMTLLLPPEIRTKVLEKNPTTMAQSAEYAAEVQCLICDKTCPLGNSVPKSWVLAIQDDVDTASLDALVLNAVDHAFKKRNFNPNNRNLGRSPANNGAKPKLQKRCTYCQKTGHS